MLEIRAWGLGLGSCPPPHFLEESTKRKKFLSDFTFGNKTTDYNLYAVLIGGLKENMEGGGYVLGIGNSQLFLDSSIFFRDQKKSILFPDFLQTLSSIF